MSQSPSDIAALASIEAELQQIVQLVDGLEQSTLAGGIFEGVSGEKERDLVMLVLLLEIRNVLGGVSAGGGGTTVVQPGGGGAQPPQIGGGGGSGSGTTTNVDVDTEAIVDALETETVVAELDAQVPANDPIITSNIEPSEETAAYRVTVAFDTDVTFSVVLDDGSDEEVLALNEGNALSSDSLYTFDVAAASEAIEVNFQSDTQASARAFVVKELSAAAP